MERRASRRQFPELGDGRAGGQDGAVRAALEAVRELGDADRSSPYQSPGGAVVLCLPDLGARPRRTGVQRVGRECTGHFQRHSLVIKIPVSVAHKKYSKNQSREPGTGHQNQRSREAGTRLPGKRACVSTFPRLSVQEGK